MDYKYEYEKLNDILKHIQEEHRVEITLLKLEYESKLDETERKFEVAKKMLEQVLLNCEG